SRERTGSRPVRAWIGPVEPNGYRSRMGNGGRSLHARSKYQPLRATGIETVSLAVAWSPLSGMVATTLPLPITSRGSIGTLDWRPTVAMSRPAAGNRISSPIPPPARVNSRSGAFVTNVRPALRAAIQLRRSSLGPLRTNTRTRPGGPRSDAKFGNASVPAPAG